MKNLILVAAVTIFLSTSAFAEILTVSPSSKMVGSTSVPLASTAVAHVGQDVNLGVVGAGLRTKFFFDIYVAELFVTDPSKFSNDQTDFKALDSLVQMPVVSLQMNFLHNVTADQIRTAFEDAFDANKIDMSSQEVAAFLKVVNSAGATAPGQKMTIVTVKNADNTDDVYFENAAGQSNKVSGPSGFAQKVMAIWLGQLVSGDSGLAALKKQIITGVK